MKFLIRFVTTNAAGGLEQSDKHIETQILTIGRATDQILHLRDRRARLQHARIEVREGAVHITSNALAGVSVNGRSQRDARLVAGDVIEVGSNILRVIEAPDGVDFAMTFELKAEVSSDDVVPSWDASATSDIGTSKRRLSWIAAGTVLLLAFVIPSLSMLGGSVASVSRSTALLPDDSWWLAGPVHGKHASTSADCQNCHVDAFRRVPDEACLACHTATRHVAVPVEPILGDARCATCHFEHNEPPSLIKQHQGLCADCHRQALASSGVDLPPAADFLDAHPRFKVSLLRPTPAPEGKIEWTVNRRYLEAAAGSDNSNLEFDHAAHLNSDGIVAPEGKRVIACTDCHVTEPGGAGMLPISMDDHCSSCHTLSFDPDEPDRSVPHGDPEAVLQVLIEYYSARLLGTDPDAAEQRVRRPGRKLSRADRDKAAAEAKVQALAVATDLFERRACVNCHEVTKAGDNAELPWVVQPVRLTAAFFPRASFSHSAHDTEVTSCNGCHNASDSDDASDVLMPGIDTCRDCHGSSVARRNDAGQTPSTCIMCHRFHVPGKGSHP